MISYFFNYFLPLNESFLKFMVCKIKKILKGEGKELDCPMAPKQNGKCGHWQEQFELDPLYGINHYLASCRIISVHKMAKENNKLGKDYSK